MAKRPKSASADSQKASSSLAFRLSSSFFFRQVGIFLAMDLLLFGLCLASIALYAEHRCAEVAGLVAQRGVPTEEALSWMEASDYTITPLERMPQGQEQFPIPWLSPREELEGGVRSWNLSAYYTVSLPNGGEPYAIRVDLSGLSHLVGWGGIILLVCQLLSLVHNLLKNNRTIHHVLRPIQELAATAARLNSLSYLSRQELQTLAGQLEGINATHLDTRISMTGTQKELQTVALAINAMLDRVNDAYSAQLAFVSDASHELRTPIAVIQGYAALLDRWGKSDPEALQESISAIRAEADAMQNLVEQLLFLARSDNDSQPIHPERFDITLLCGEVLQEEEMIHPGRPFVPRWDRALEVEADPALIKQALRILVDNAIKYSGEHSPIILQAERTREEARLSVQDEGQGISPEALPHIFDRFYRTDESRARQTGGTGLGLAIAKWIVERHKGHFEVVSREGIGSRFTMVLPLPPPKAP